MSRHLLQLQINDSEMPVKIRRIRETLNVSSFDFAEMLEIDEKLLLELESGSKSIIAYYLLLLSDKFDLDLVQLIQNRAEEINYQLILKNFI